MTPPRAASPAGAGRPKASASPPELERPFRLIAFDWDGTAVASRAADATRVARLLDALLARGVRIVVITGTSFENVARQLLGSHLRPANLVRLSVAANRGSEVFGFDRRGRRLALWRRVATPEEDRRLDAVADEARARLERLTGLSIGVVRDRMNRRKLDLVPVAEWADPPKSAIGELLGAVEARLRGAGLLRGLREAFELTERAARELGLEGARITSDVKHIEVGLTDKSDSMAWLFRELAAPLGIAPAHVLLAGDEFGPIGGFEGSDHRMLALPAVAGAVVVSVGPEPGGAPERVHHLGGGPDRFCEMLEEQLGLDERLGPFASTRDAAWIIEDAGFDPAREHEVESLLAIGNGYVGTRGSIAERTSVSRPATFLAGAFEPSADLSRVPELVIAPEWARLRILVEGEPFGLEGCSILEHRRTLDLRRGLLLRDTLGCAPAGHVTHLGTLHAASMAERHALLEAVRITPQNFIGSIRLDAMLSGDVKSASGATHWASFVSHADGDGSSLEGTTTGGLGLAMTSRTEIRRFAGEDTVHVERAAGATWASERYHLGASLGETSELTRTVTLFTSRDVPSPSAAAHALRKELAERPFDELLRDHERAWAERWRRADVVIDGAPRLERALRFAAYHLLSSVNPADPRCSIGARALTGEAYRGHVFWDTETFMLPFFTHCFPEAARALLEYRHRTLDGARRKARELGYDGALYAWESAETGDETTPRAIVTPFGEIIQVLSGVMEHHIAADVAHAIVDYARVTGDRAFLEGPGREILVETARLWASRAEIDGDGVAHIRHVIGPDEYHEDVDDNAFTNWMARFNLRAAADLVERTAGRGLVPEVSPDEVRRLRDVADRLALGLDPKRGVIEQFTGFFGLAPLDLASYEPRTAPMDVLLGRARTQASQVVKQADVVQLVAMLWDEVAPDVRRASYLYYEPRTSHGSSLSPGMHALVAARLRLFETCARYLDMTADIDLGNRMGNAAGGVHAAALGSLWQAVVLGVGGVRAAPGPSGALVLEPALLPGWRHLAFPLCWHGRVLEVHVEPDALELAVEGDSPLEVQAVGPGGPPRALRAEPGRRYAARLDAEGYAAWEEVSS
jgi:kojibiose phosphorylase